MKLSRRVILRGTGFGAAAIVLTAFGAGCWFVVSHREIVAASPQLAQAEFSELRQRFGGHQPILDMVRREPTAPPRVLRGASLRAFHTVIFDTRGGNRIVRLAVPYWFARRFAASDGEFKWLGQLTSLDDTEFDSEPIRLPLDQLERRGPGLVAYYRHPGGGQFIAWVE